ncbi:MAG: hypothetical protein HY720_11125 [Planctomycetes bacterium]|nr:hypothetical protein [Planctomycetota bacterium]
MRHSGLPDPIAKRDILYDPDRPAREKVATADAYFEVGRYQDALSFYREACHAQGLSKVRELALEEGDAFLFAGAEMPGEAPSPEDWRRLAAHALELGKFRFAAKAFEKLGDEEAKAAALAKLQEAMVVAAAEEAAFEKERKILGGATVPDRSVGLGLGGDEAS